MNAQPMDSAADHVRLYSAAGCLDFGKFRHELARKTGGSTLIAFRSSNSLQPAP
jgi:hypothetical protein